MRLVHPPHNVPIVHRSQSPLIYAEPHEEAKCSVMMGFVVLVHCILTSCVEVSSFMWQDKSAYIVSRRCRRRAFWAGGYCTNNCRLYRELYEDAPASTPTPHRNIYTWRERFCGKHSCVPLDSMVRKLCFCTACRLPWNNVKRSVICAECVLFFRASSSRLSGGALGFFHRRRDAFVKPNGGKVSPSIHAAVASLAPWVGVTALSPHVITIEPPVVWGWWNATVFWPWPPRST